MATKRKKPRARSGTSAASGRSLKAAAIVAGVGVGMFVAYQAFGASPEHTPSSKRKPAAGPKGKPGTSPQKTLPPRPASAAPDVATVQRALVALGGEPAREIMANGGIDGKPGPALQRALQAAGLPALENFDKTTYPKLLNLGANAAAAARRLGLTLPVLGPPVPTPGVPDFVAPEVIQRLVLPPPTPRPAAKAAPRRARPVARPVVKAAPRPAARPAAQAAPRKPFRAATPLLNRRPVALLPADTARVLTPSVLAPRPANWSALRPALYGAVASGNRNALVGVLQRLQTAADWQQLSAVPAGKTPWRDKRSRPLEVSIAQQFGLVNNSIAQQFMRLGLRYDVPTNRYVSTLG